MKNLHKLMIFCRICALTLNHHLNLVFIIFITNKTRRYDLTKYRSLYCFIKSCGIGNISIHIKIYTY